MIKKLVYQLLRPRHFWRDVTFDELSELYVSMMFRNLALSLVGLFVPIYLHELGFDLVTILRFFGVFFLARIVWDVISGYVVARIGPKHTMAISYLMQVVALGMFTTYRNLDWPIFLIAIVWGAANSLFFIAYHTDFSKIKHTRHGGKELGFMTIMERLGAMAGPITGGLIATLFGAQFTFLAATIFFAIGAIPLFLTGEPVRLKQQLRFRSLDVTDKVRDYVSYASLGVENTLCIVLWPLFLALFVFHDAVYASVGVIASLAVIVSVLSAKAIGSMTDNYRGRALLRYSTVANTMLHLVRPSVGGFGGALAVNMVNEIATIGYRLPYTKGFYDEADRMPGYRIVFIVSMEMTSAMAKATAYFILSLLAVAVDSYTVLYAGFMIAAIASLLIMTERFPVLNQRKSRGI